jgi:hypothetical protein
MNKTVSELRKILGRVAKDGKQTVMSQMEEQCLLYVKLFVHPINA